VTLFLNSDFVGTSVEIFAINLFLPKYAVEQNKLAAKASDWIEQNADTRVVIFECQQICML